MKVLVLSPKLYDTAPALRFRIEQWARRLEGDGFHFDFVSFEDRALHDILYQPGKYLRKTGLVLRALLRRFACLRQVRSYDLVFLHREAAILGPAVIERLIADRGVPMIYDFDDPIWLTYRSPTNSLFNRLRFPGKTAAICRLASRVFAGNRLLAGWAQHHNPFVDVVPSTIDMVHYPAKGDCPSNDTVTLGWTGSHSTLPFLESIVPVLKRLSKQHEFRLVVISHTDTYHIDGLSAEVVSKRWNAATEAQDLQEIDIGLAPFPDSGWTPWRCHGKVLQYMASAIPTIASQVGILPDYIKHGADGFLATSEEQWLEALNILVSDGVARREIGLRGRQVIEDRYSAQIWAPRVAELLQSAATGKPKIFSQNGNVSDKHEVGWG